MAEKQTLTPSDIAATLCVGDDLVECVRALQLALETADAWKKCRNHAVKVAFWRDVAIIVQRYIETLDLDELVARAK